MKKDEIITYLKENESLLKTKYKIASLALFSLHPKLEESQPLTIALYSTLEDYTLLYRFQKEIEEVVQTQIHIIRIRDNMNDTIRNMILKDGLFVWDRGNKVIELIRLIIHAIEAIEQMSGGGEGEPKEETIESIYVKLISISELLESINVMTEKKLFLRYMEIDWQLLIDMRHFISHQYFNLDREMIMSICHTKIHPLLIALRKIIKELEWEAQIEKN